MYHFYEGGRIIYHAQCNLIPVAMLFFAVMQEGVISAEAVDIATSGGLQVVQDRCVFVEAAKRLG